MPKKIIQDVIPKGRRSIRSLNLERKESKVIPVPKKIILEEHAHKETIITKDRVDVSEDRGESITITRARKTPTAKVILWGIVILALFGLVMSVTSLFSVATVSITPKTYTVSFTNNTYNASPQGDGILTLPYETITKERIEQVAVNATNTETVSVKAKGTIVVYNNFSSSPQKLVAGTRFEATDGRIYKTPIAIIIPGITTKDGKKVPGSKEVILTASEPGEKYNMQLSDLAGDFKIPGLKGTSKYTLLYGRQKTNIEGGFVGTRSVISKEQRDATILTLHEKLKNEIAREVFAELPPSYTLYDTLYTITYAPLPDIQASTSSAPVLQEKAMLFGILLNSETLAKFIAYQKNIALPKIPVVFSALDTFSIKAPSNILTPNFALTFSGTAQIEGVLDIPGIQKSLAGKKKSDGATVLKGWPVVEAAYSVIRPFWRLSYPDTSTRINIINTNTTP